MDSFSVKNFKSLKDSGNIEIKPVNFFVGRNSSGKSSLLRLFPLLKQSVMKRTKGPVLFFGEEVDFGTFDDVLFSGTNDDFIELSFGFDMTVFFGRERFVSKSYMSNLSSYDKIKITIRFIKSSDVGVKVSNIKINTSDLVCSIDMDDKHKVGFFTVNDESINIGDNEYLITDYNGVIPTISSSGKLSRPGYYFYRVNVFSGAVDAMFKIIRENVHRNTLDNTILQGCNKLTFGSHAKVKKQMIQVFSGKTFNKFIENSGDNVSEVIRSFIFARDSFHILDLISDYMRFLCSNVKYIKPLRAAAERYYRPQDLQVEEVSSDGSNLAVFIRNINPREKSLFDKWTYDKFGITLRVASDGGHYSLRLKDNSSKEYNVADLGFGYSQILPIITQIWSTVRSRRSRFLNCPIVYAIEQPELHLHPAYQAKFADLIVSAINEAGENSIAIKFIIETHSDAIINRIGRRIAENKLHHQDVNIVLFDKDIESEATTCAFSFYDQRGFLQEWPYGFFDAEAF